ncbi:hypothetical protein QJQ45_022897 [Haematococcus lacustris]|nr:hypothetical protein QJQ45_022897 [Haematococcus lacustris]
MQPAARDPKNISSGNVIQLAPGALDPDNAETTLAQLDQLASLQRRPAAATTTQGSARASTAANPGPTPTRPAHRLLPLYREAHAAADSMIGGIDEDLDAWQPQGQLPRHVRGGVVGGTVGPGPAASLLAPGMHPAAAPAPTQGSVVTAAGGSGGLSRHPAPSAPPPPSCAPTSNAGSSAVTEGGGGQLVAAGRGAEAGSRTGVEYELVEKAGDVLGPARFELQLNLPLLTDLSAAEVEVGGRQVSVQVPGQRLIVSPTELPALETALETPQQSSRDASTWGQKRPRTCLGRGALQQLSMDQQQLQGAQHQLALDQQQLQGAKRQLTLDQEQLQGAQHQLALDQQQLKGAKRQLTLDQEQLQGAQHQLALDQQQLQGAKRQLTLDQEQLQGAQHQLALDQQQLQGAKRQLTLDQEQLQGRHDGAGAQRATVASATTTHGRMDKVAPTMLPSHAAMQTCNHSAMQPCNHAAMQPGSQAARQPGSQAAMQPEMRHICFMRNCVPRAAAQAAYSQALPPVRLHNSFSILNARATQQLVQLLRNQPSIQAALSHVAMSAKHQVGVMVLDRINALQAGTCGLVGGQTLDDMQAKAVLACIVPPELREHRLLRAFSRLTGKPSPSRKDLRTWRSVIMTATQFHGKEEPTNTVTNTKRFTDCSVPDLHRMYKQEQAAAGQPAVSLHTFMALMPPWIARLSAAQRQVCVCKTCCNIKLVLTVLAQHKAGLALELTGPAPGTAAPPPAAPGAGTAAPPPGALGAAVEDGDGDTAQLLAADSPFVDPNGEFEHPHTHHHLPVPPPVLAASPSQLSATSVRGLYMCSCGPDAPHQARCCHRTCSDCKDKCMKLKPGVDGSIMLSVKQYAPVKQKEGPARIELQQFRLSLHEVVDKLNEQMPSYIWHHFVAHHQLAVFRRQQQAVQEKGDHGRVVISCDWSERLSVERPTEIQSDHWHHHNVGIFVACAYFRNDRDEYREETVYVLTDGKDQSAAVTQAALHQVLDYLQGERCMVMKQLCMWSDGCAAQFKGTPALQLHRRMAMRYRVPVWWSYGATSHFKGRHDSEGGVYKHSMAARVLADHPVLSAECKAQQLAGVHNVECAVPAAQLAASVAHQTRGSVQRRWCLVLKDEEVEQCAEPDPDAHRLLRTISGSRAMHAMFFPADGVAPMWSETACACVRHMGSKPQQCMCHGASTLSSIPMFGRVTLASDKEEDAECLKLLHARAPHIASSYMTLTVHLLKEYARGCLGWKGKRLTQKKPLLRADILEHLRWEQEMEEDQLAEVGDDEANDM